MRGTGGRARPLSCLVATGGEQPLLAAMVARVDDTWGPALRQDPAAALETGMLLGHGVQDEGH